MKISIITAALNNKETIEQTITSISSQVYKSFEHIIIDGGSTDGTLDVIKNNGNLAKLVSEPDRGMYDALNKGINVSSGDVIGFLNGDDFYAHDQVLKMIRDVCEQQNVDSCYGDLQYVWNHNTNKVIRYWKSSPYAQGKFKHGWMPPHPTFFVKREIYEKYGQFNTDFQIAADYELMVRFLEKYRISTSYIPEVLIRMRVGGMSNRSLKNLFIKSYEDYKAWKVNNLDGGLFTIFLKNICKIPQFFPGRG